MAGQATYESWTDFLNLAKPTLTGVVALIALVFVFCGNLVETVQAVLLVRRMNPQGKRGTVAGALWLVATELRADPRSLLTLVHFNIFDRVRMRLEHEIFFPRPHWQWPPEEGLPFGKERTAGAIKALRKGKWGEFRKERREWRARMKRMRNESCIIQDLTAGQLSENSQEIERYFYVLDSLNQTWLPGFKIRELSFHCPVQVSHGYIAPLHLLTGLLAQYKGTWLEIIKRFEAQTSNYTDLPEEMARVGDGALDAHNFRQIQSFIYYCWLLWGPSIPISDCEEWTGDWLSLQYGYGDENNSIEIVGPKDALKKELDGLIEAMIKQPGGLGDDSQPMALPAYVFGTLKYSRIAWEQSQKGLGKLTPLLEKTWRGGQDSRPVLSVPAVVPERERKKVPSEKWLLLDSRSGESRYYSAYLWVMFVLLKHDGKRWLPLKPDEDDPRHSLAPWKGVIPFFEHGNIADSQSCDFAKQVLADKVIGAIQHFAKGYESDGFPLRFAYAAAIDDSNCGHGLKFAALAGGKTIRQRISERLSDLPKDIIDWETYKGNPKRHPQSNPHSACSLPGDMELFYAEIGKSRKERGAAKSREGA